MTLPLFPEPPRPPPPPRQEKPKPTPYVPDTEGMKRREQRILAALPGTLDDILRRGSPHLSQSATVCDLTFMVAAGTIVRSDDPEPMYSLPRSS